jgi:hypothetical protein
LNTACIWKCLVNMDKNGYAGVYIYMVGGIPTPLKNMKVSWDHVQYISCIFDGCLLDLVFHVYIH